MLRQKGSQIALCYPNGAAQAMCDQITGIHPSAHSACRDAKTLRDLGYGEEVDLIPPATAVGKLA